MLFKFTDKGLTIDGQDNYMLFKGNAFDFIGVGKNSENLKVTIRNFTCYSLENRTLFQKAKLLLKLAKLIFSFKESESGEGE